MEEQKKQTQKRMIFNITPKLHHQVKSRASFRNISMRQWITEAIIRTICEEDKYR